MALENHGMDTMVGMGHEHIALGEMKNYGHRTVHHGM